MTKAEYFYYECAVGHTWNAPYQFFTCPVFVLGNACTAPVKRLTAGGRGWKEKDANSANIG